MEEPTNEVMRYHNWYDTDIEKAYLTYYGVLQIQFREEVRAVNIKEEDVIVMAKQLGLFVHNKAT
jgi:hypothetical protein